MPAARGGAEDVEVAIEAAHDADRDTVGELAQWVADRDRALAHAQCRRVTERQCGHVLTVHLDEGEVGEGVDAAHGAVHDGPVLEDDIDRVGIADDVAAGQDETCGIDDDTGAGATGIWGAGTLSLSARAKPLGTSMVTTAGRAFSMTETNAWSSPCVAMEPVVQVSAAVPAMERETMSAETLRERSRGCGIGVLSSSPDVRTATAPTMRRGGTGRRRCADFVLPRLIDPSESNPGVG